jgi:hypothetical protein
LAASRTRCFLSFFCRGDLPGLGFDLYFHAFQHKCPGKSRFPHDFVRGEAGPLKYLVQQVCLAPGQYQFFTMSS